jgi:coenzyme F420-reducing hydrogenase beta subunit
MEADTEGFRYPVIDETQCVQCGRCEKVCPVLNFRSTADGGNAYAVHNRSNHVVRSSSSGGVFTALAERTIRDGGVVYGAAFESDFSVAHRRVDTVEALTSLRGSKYVQSDMGTTYACVRRDLKAGRPVLFSGTPCQAAGLRQFLGHDDPRLLCVDIICHSVPSLKVWRSCLGSLGKTAAVNFRDKRDGWERYYLTVELEDGREVRVRGRDNRYMSAMVQGLSTRPSCYRCSFKGEHRACDITLGDFWGVEVICPDAFHREGTSLILIQSEKGQAAFDAVVDALDAVPVNREEALAGNPAYAVAARPHEQRSLFFEQLEQTSFVALVDSLLPPAGRELKQSCVLRALRKIKRILHHG